MANPVSGFLVNESAPAAKRRSTREAHAVAWAFLQAGDLAKAENAYCGILMTAPDDAEAWHLLGWVCQSRNRFAEAVDHYRQSLHHDPGNPAAWNNLAAALQKLGRTEEAEPCCRQALRIEPAYDDAHTNLGNVLHARGRYAEARACYERALELHPDHVDVLHNLGNSYQTDGRPTEALECYEKALRISPGHARVNLSRAMLFLQAGDLKEGFAGLRWQYEGADAVAPFFAGPRWEGSPLDGETILLHDHQGMGDMLQFIRYAPMVAERGGRVVVACSQPLVRILKACPGVVDAFSRFEQTQTYQYQRVVMSLPELFETTLETIPASVPYLSTDPAEAAKWAEEMHGVDGLKIGIAWQGNPEHHKDHERSFPLALFEGLAKVPGVRLYSLQKGVGAEQLHDLGGRFEVADMGSRVSDFLDTAALIQNLDLVIAPDSALAHLAGALGAPVWVALPYAPDWRWMLHREDSLWYPSMRLFRQPRWGDWNAVFERIASQASSHSRAG